MFEADELRALIDGMLVPGRSEVIAGPELVKPTIPPEGDDSAGRELRIWQHRLRDAADERSRLRRWVGADNAGWHVAKELAIPPNAVLHHLPSCTPELQSV